MASSTLRHRTVDRRQWTAEPPETRYDYSPWWERRPQGQRLIFNEASGLRFGAVEMPARLALRRGHDWSETISQKARVVRHKHRRKEFSQAHDHNRTH